ncbi:MAG: hypothetical protein ACRDPY_15785 [Streptosporangiaceae bacterium]
MGERGVAQVVQCPRGGGGEQAGVVMPGWAIGRVSSVKICSARR